MMSRVIHLFKPLIAQIVRYRIVIIIIAIMVSGLMGGYAVYQVRPFNSDDVTIQTIVQTTRLFDGNSAYTGPDNFFIKAPVYALTNLLPHSRKVLFGIYILNLGVLVACLVLALRAIGLRLVAPLLTLVWVLSLKSFVLTELINPNSRNVEIGLSILISAILLWYVDSKRSDSKGLLCLLVILSSVLMYSDPYFKYVVFVPLAAFLLLWFVFRSDMTRAHQQRVARAIGVIVLALVLSWCFRQLSNWLGYFAVGDINSSFVALGDIPRNLSVLVFSLLKVFNADFFGRNISVGSIVPIFGALMIVVTISSPLMLATKDVRRSPAKSFIALLPLFTLLVFLLNANVRDIGSARYIIILPFLTPIIIGMWYELLQSRRAKLWLLVIIATMGAAGIFLGMKMAYIQRNEVDPNSNQIKVLNVLKDKGLKKGYAEYWDAGILTFFSNNRAVVLPVACSDSGIVLRRWLMDEALIDVETDRSFILYRKPPVRGSGCKIEDKLAKLGSPVEIIDIGSGYNISIYDRDLFPGAKRN